MTGKCTRHQRRLTSAFHRGSRLLGLAAQRISRRHDCRNDLVALRDAAGDRVRIYPRGRCSVVLIRGMEVNLVLKQWPMVRAGTTFESDFGFHHLQFPPGSLPHRRTQPSRRLAPKGGAGASTYTGTRVWLPCV